MTRFEKIKQELTLEKMAEFIDGCCDEYREGLFVYAYIHRKVFTKVGKVRKLSAL